MTDVALLTAGIPSGCLLHFCTFALLAIFKSWLGALANASPLPEDHPDRRLLLVGKRWRYRLPFLRFGVRSTRQ